MTYCLAIKVEKALVFASDSRTNAGPDQLSIYSKMHTWGVDGERQFFLLAAGNLATTQAVVHRITNDIEDVADENLYGFKRMTDAVRYIGKINLQEQRVHADGVTSAGFNAEATFIFGGQVGERDSRLFMVYPQGNYISCSDHAPFLQIGETKYGKPILDRIVRPDTPVELAVRSALVSLDSTMKSNATVGPPIELSIYENNSLMPGAHRSLDADDTYLQNLKNSWDNAIIKAFEEMPDLPLIDEEQQLTLSK